MSANAQEDDFKVKFSNREVSAWGGMALLKRMLDQFVSAGRFAIESAIYPGHLARPGIGYRRKLAS